MSRRLMSSSYLHLPEVTITLDELPEGKFWTISSIVPEIIVHARSLNLAKALYFQKLADIHRGVYHSIYHSEKS